MYWPRNTELSIKKPPDLFGLEPEPGSWVKKMTWEQQADPEGAGDRGSGSLTSRGPWQVSACDSRRSCRISAARRRLSKNRSYVQTKR